MARLEPGSTRFLAVPGQLLVFVLLIGPTLGLVVAGMLPAPEGVAWRSRMVGMTVDTMIVPVFALFLGVFLAAHLQHRRLQWLHTVLAGILGLAFLVMLPLYALDALEVRARIAPEMRGPYDASVGRNLFLFLSYGAALVLLGVMSVRQLRRSRAAAESEAQSPLVGSAHAARATPRT